MICFITYHFVLYGNENYSRGSDHAICIESAVILLMYTYNLTKPI